MGSALSKVGEAVFLVWEGLAMQGTPSLGLPVGGCAVADRAPGAQSWKRQTNANVQFTFRPAAPSELDQIASK